MSKRNNKYKTPKEIKKDFNDKVDDIKKDIEEEKKNNPKYKDLMLVLKEGNNRFVKVLCTGVDLFAILYCFVAGLESIPYWGVLIGEMCHISKESSTADYMLWFLMCLFILAMLIILEYKVCGALWRRIKYRFRRDK